MVDDIPVSPTPIAPTRVGTASALLRLVWMLGLPVTLLCVLFIANQPTWTLGRLDLVLAALVTAAVAARALDALRYGGTTASGDPAGRSHVLAYALALVLPTGLAWFLAQSVAL